MPDHDMVIVIGDANAKVGDSNQGWDGNVENNCG